MNSRNQFKTTAAEEARLARMTIGVVGLSAGNVIARTIALGGIAGRLVLVDGDHLEL